MDSSRILAWLLGVEAVLAGVGMVVTGTLATGPFGRAMTMGGYVAMLVLCALAMWMELRHERRAESLALVALAVSWIMALIGGLESQYLLAPAQAIVAFAAAFALVERFIERDEATQAAH
jgi:hypothetical protein